jgi:hypothetical protein
MSVRIEGVQYSVVQSLQGFFPNSEHRTREAIREAGYFPDRGATGVEGARQRPPDSAPHEVEPFYAGAQIRQSPICCRIVSFAAPVHVRQPY